MIRFSKKAKRTLGVIALAVALASCSTSTGEYDEQAHRAEIEAIYPGVKWPEYREAMRDVCDQPDRTFAYTVSLAAQDGPEAARAMAVSVRYMCPDRASQR